MTRKCLFSTFTLNKASLLHTLGLLQLNPDLFLSCLLLSLCRFPAHICTFKREKQTVFLISYPCSSSLNYFFRCVSCWTFSLLQQAGSSNVLMCGSFSVVHSEFKSSNNFRLRGQQLLHILVSSLQTPYNHVPPTNGCFKSWPPTLPVGLLKIDCRD